MVKDWLESVYATVRYWVDPRFRAQVKLYRTLIERSVLGQQCVCSWIIVDGVAVFKECESCEDYEANL